MLYNWYSMFPCWNQQPWIQFPIVQPPPLPTTVNDEPEFKISEILNSKIDNHHCACKLLHLVCWTGYEGTDEENSWILILNSDMLPHMFWISTLCTWPSLALFQASDSGIHHFSIEILFFEVHTFYDSNQFIILFFHSRVLLYWYLLTTSNQTPIQLWAFLFKYPFFSSILSFSPSREKYMSWSPHASTHGSHSHLTPHLTPPPPNSSSGGMNLPHLSTHNAST